MNKYTEIMFNVLLTIAAIALLISIVGLCQAIKQDKYDVNNDGTVSAADYVAVKNYVMEEC